MREIYLIAHNIRSTHNVGALLRTADGLGLTHVYLTGYTPAPQFAGDSRLPHLARKIHKDITKTALGAEETVRWTYQADITKVVSDVKHRGAAVIGLEQDPSSVMLPNYHPPEKVALLLGEEVKGLAPELRATCDALVEIPMFGRKESFNVSVAAGMALYHLRFS